jgi:hypothetical protein
MASYRGCWRLLILCFLAFTGTRCSPRQPPTALPTQPDVPRQTKSELLPPTWGARFVNPTQLESCLELSSSSELCFGAIGERWLDEASGAIASPYLAPETLVAARPTTDNQWVFVGVHGSRFLAETPLGPFTSARRPPQKYARFTVVAGRWYGITSDGELWSGSWDDLNGTRFSLPTPIFDFAITPSGTGMALGLPERIWTTRNRGVNWEALEISPVGATNVTVSDRGIFGVTALLPQVTRPIEGVSIHDAKEALGQAIRLRNKPALFLEAQGLVEGRSAEFASQVVELRKLDDGWHVGIGAIDQPLTFAKAKGLENCTAIRLAVSAQSSLALCRQENPKDSSGVLTLYQSDKAAQDFAQLQGNILGRFNDIHVVALGADHFIATGICVPSTSQRGVEPGPSQSLVNAKTVRDCIPKSPVSIKLSQSPTKGSRTFGLTPVAAAGAHVTARPMAVSKDGQLVAFVSRADISKPWLLYFSNDAAKTFSGHSIDELPITNGVEPLVPRARSKLAQRESRSVLSLNFGEDRSLSLVLRDGDSPIVANFDDRGNLVATTATPPGVSRVGAVGARILAVSLTERAVYESLDRGASFELVGHLPAAACLTDLSCPVTCTSAGCLIGERFTRVSWGGRGNAILDIAGNPGSLEPGFEPVTERVMFRTPLVCQSDTRVMRSGFTLTRAPLPEQTSLGDVLWYSPWLDWSKASAGLYRALRGRSVVEQMVAFAPVSHAERAGMAMNFDDAGLAYMRSKQLPKVGEPLGDLELAWMRFKQSNWSHARFRDAAAMNGADSYVTSGQRARRLLPAQLTVSGEGVILNAHADDSHQLENFYVTANGASAIEKLSWPVERVREQQLMREPDAWNAFAFDETGSVLLHARKSLGDPTTSIPWKFVARTVANPRGASTSPDRVKMYLGGTRPILVLGTSARGHQLHSLSAHDVPANLGPLGKALTLPLPASLSEPPPVCSLRDRRELSRFVVPLLPAAARALGMRGSDNQVRWLVTNYAIMYASSARACLDALWAVTLPGTTPIHAIVQLGDPGHAWVFFTRRTQGEEKVDVQAISCQFDAAARPPPELETRAQARFNLERLPLGE